MSDAKIKKRLLCRALCLYGVHLEEYIAIQTNKSSKIPSSQDFTSTGYKPKVLS